VGEPDWVAAGDQPGSPPCRQPQAWSAGAADPGARSA
jgi:hypothetical protein